MELRHLRYLVALADEGSFVSAALKVRVAQPALSRQIRDFEREVGADLLTRDSRGCALTPAGRAAVELARQILDNAELAIRKARMASEGLVGRCVIGTGRVMCWNGLVPRIIERARAEFPGIELHVEERSLRLQWEGLTDCSLDIGIGTAPPPVYNRIASEMQALDVIDAIGVARQHPMAARSSIRLDDLRDETYLHRDDEGLGEQSRLLRGEFARRGFVPAREIGTASLEELLMQVRAGSGWSMVPRSMRSHVSREFAIVPLEDLAVPACYSRLWRRGDSRPVIKTMLALCRRIADESGAGGLGTVGATSRDADRQAHDYSPIARLELRHLRYFTAIVEEGSIGRAAERLGLTQPALSRQARDLESVVGAVLLERVTRGVTATLAGESLYMSGLGLLRDAERFAGEATRAQRGAAHACIIGMVSTPIAVDIATRAIRECNARHPDIVVSINDVPTPKQPAALQEARIDLGIGHAYPNGGGRETSVIRSVLAEDHLDSAIVAADSPLARRASIKLEELGDLPLLFMRPGFNNGFYETVMATFARAGYRPHIEGEYDGLTTVWTLAARGLGWCLGATSQRAVPPAGVAVIPLEDFAVPFGAELVRRDDEARAPVLIVIEALLRAADARAAEHDKPRNEVLAAS